MSIPIARRETCTADGRPSRDHRAAQTCLRRYFPEGQAMSLGARRRPPPKRSRTSHRRPAGGLKAPPGARILGPLSRPAPGRDDARCAARPAAPTARPPPGSAPSAACAWRAPARSAASRSARRRSSARTAGRAWGQPHRRPLHRQRLCPRATRPATWPRRSWPAARRWPASASRSPPLLASSHVSPAWIERRVQAVPHEIGGHHRQRDREAGEDRRPPGDPDQRLGGV